MKRYYRITVLHNHGNLALVPYTAVVRNEHGLIVRRFGRFSYNGALRRARRWTGKRS